jgi:hypothetical protein
VLPAQRRPGARTPLAHPPRHPAAPRRHGALLLYDTQHLYQRERERRKADKASADWAGTREAAPTLLSQPDPEGDPQQLAAATPPGEPLALPAGGLSKWPSFRDFKKQ